MGWGGGIKAAAVLAPSLTGLARSNLPATGNGLPTHPLCADTSLGYLGEAGPVGTASYLTPNSISKPTPSPGFQSLGPKESRKSPDVAQHLTDKRMEDQVC